MVGDEGWMGLRAVGGCRRMLSGAVDGHIATARIIRSDTGAHLVWMIAEWKVKCMAELSDHERGRDEGQAVKRLGVINKMQDRRAWCFSLG
jgi:hypothetical protein